MELTGAEIIIECLKEQKVDTIFGFPGGAVIHIYDALYREGEIRHILTAHEQGAAHAADGYARATGKVGVCLATSGPGATNLVTGIATAFLDSIPLVAITGNVAQSLLGKDSFQEVDITGITMPITKHNFIVKNIDELAATMRRAFYIAQEGRPGPVLIDIPKNITAQSTNYEYESPNTIAEGAARYNPTEIDQALEMINKAQRPLFYIGGGVIRSQSSKELKELVELIQAPLTSSLMGLGGFPGNHPLHTGMVGMHGTKASNLAVTECDLLIAVGTRFSDRVISNVSGFAPRAEIIHIDIDPAETNKNIRTRLSLIGPIKEILNRIREGVIPVRSREWIDQIQQWKSQYPLSYGQNGVLRPQYIIEKIHELTQGKAIITTEVGQNQIWAAQYFDYTEPRSFITPGGLGTMGFGLGAAIGVKLAQPHKRVFNIAGDGSFHMNCNELSTAVKYRLPIIVVVLNNHVLGMVRQWQSLFFENRYSQTSLEQSTNIPMLAEAFGAKGLQITKPQEVESVLREAMEAEGPVVINCEIDRDEMVFPIVPPGALIKDLITEAEEK